MSTEFLSNTSFSPFPQRGGVLCCVRLAHKNFSQRIQNGLRRLLWALWILVQYAYIWGTYSVASSDCWVVHDFAFDFVRNSNVFLWYTEYFSMYSNNILLGFISIVIQKLIPVFSIEDVWLITSFIAALLADVAIYWTLRLVVYNLGEEYYGIAFLASCLLIGLSEEASILYSDILSLWTIPFAGFHICKSLKETDQRRKYLDYLYSGWALGFGGAIKPQILIFLIAGAIVAIVRVGIQKKTFDAWKPFLLGILVCVVTCTCLANAGKQWFCDSVISRSEENPQQYFEDTEFPLLHWMNMGLNEQSLGGYSLDDVEATKAIAGKEHKSAVLKESIRDRLANFGLFGYLKFVNKKVVFALQNGTFSEGVTWKGACINNEEIAKKIQNVFLSTSKNWKYSIAILIQVTYLGCLWCSSANAIFSLIKKENDIVQIAQITLLGDVIFLAMFERNMRYFFSVLPLLIFLAINGIDQFTKLKRSYVKDESFR